MLEIQNYLLNFDNYIINVFNFYPTISDLPNIYIDR